MSDSSISAPAKPVRQRPIRFRVWNNARNEWAHPTEHAVNLFGETIVMGMFMSSVPLAEYNDCVAEQFTGLLDSKGREIYEGDILTGGAVVEWFDRLVWDGTGSPHPGFWCKQWLIHPEKERDMNWDDGFGKMDVEVIGNVHEHPALIRAV